MNGNLIWRWALTNLPLEFSTAIPLITPQSLNSLVFSHSKFNPCKCRKQRTNISMRTGWTTKIQFQKQAEILFFLPAPCQNSSPSSVIPKRYRGGGGIMGRGVKLKYHHPYLDLILAYLFWTFLPSLLSSAYIPTFSSSVIWFPICENWSSGAELPYSSTVPVGSPISFSEFLRTFRLCLKINVRMMF
jgi:hypothetical protein